MIRESTLLTHLSIRDLAVVERLSLEIDNGLTVLTGETGAGKSILIDALSLALGARAQSGMVRTGAERAEVTALFDVRSASATRAELTALEMDDNDELHLRRTLGADGRSRAYINGRPVPAGMLRDLGATLVDIHGQHEHQSLLHRQHQRALVDQLAGLDDLVDQVAHAFEAWKMLDNERAALARGHADHGARQQLLRYQCEELQQLSPQPDEYQALLVEHKQLTGREELRITCFDAVALLEHSDSTSADALVRQAQQSIQDVDDTGIPPILELLESATIHIREAAAAMLELADARPAEPERLAHVERRLTQLQDIARKHHTTPLALPEVWAALEAELTSADDEAARASSVAAEQAQTLSQYVELSTQLSAGRQAAATGFAQSITRSMHALGMPGGTCEVSVTSDDPEKADFVPHAHGLDAVEILVSANPGAAPQPLSRVASGGELSRISLAIQVQLARGAGVPSLVFDEVDVGVGGRVAEIVGKMLREVAGQRQVLCITHLPQVACQGVHHLRVSKQTDRKTAESTLEKLTAGGRVEEIARMLGGEKITKRTRAHAREMLQLVTS